MMLVSASSFAYAPRKPEPPNRLTLLSPGSGSSATRSTSPSSNPERPMPHWSISAPAFARFSSSLMSESCWV